MNTLVRYAACVTVAGSVVAALGAFRPTWAVRRGLDWWSLPEARKEVRTLRNGFTQLDAQRDNLLARTDGRREVVRELRRGRRNLFEAAAAFRELNARPGAPASLERYYFAASADEETLCRQVITWVRNEQHEEPPEAARERAARLEAELEAHLRHHGGVRLPGEVSEPRSEADRP